MIELDLKRKITKVEIQHKLRELGQKVTGKKAELEELLRNIEGINHQQFSIFKDQITLKKRPSGERFTLNGMSTILEQTFGIRSRTLSLHDLLQMSKRAKFEASKNHLNQSLSECLKVDKFNVNMKICNFCFQREACNSEEVRKFRDSISFEVRSHKDLSSTKDPTKIQQWLEERVTNLKGTPERMVFSNFDPFKPGFGLNRTGEYFIHPLEELKFDGSSRQCDWNHIFYSKILQRTLTIFEATYINSAIAVVKTLSDDRDEFPKIQDIIQFIKQTISIRDFENRKTIDLKRMREGLDSSGILGKNISLLKGEHHFLYSILIKTKKYFDSGLYNKKLELFATLDQRISFQDQLFSLWIEIVKAVQKTTLQKSTLFFETRTQAQIFYPAERGTSKIPIQSLGHMQILRLVPINGLEQEWILTNNKQQLEYPFRKNTPPSPHLRQLTGIRDANLYKDWFNHEVEINGDLVSLFETSNRQYLPLEWTEHFSLRSKSFIRENSTLSIFPPKDIYSAMSMNLLIKKFINSPGNLNHKKHHEQFHAIMNEVFFSTFRDKNLQMSSEDESALAEMYKEYLHPKYKRLKPLDIIKKISQIEYCKPYINYTKIIKESLYVTEKITLTSPGYTISDEVEEEQLRWEFIKRYEKGGFGNSELLQNSKWINSLSEGRKLDLGHRRIKSFEELINSRTTVFEDGNKILSVYLSPAICTILGYCNFLSKRLAQIIKDIINQMSLFGCPFIFTPEEEKDLISLIGHMDAKTIHLHGTDCVVKFGLPSEVIRDNSPNFLHVGVLL